MRTVFDDKLKKVMIVTMQNVRDIIDLDSVKVADKEFQDEPVYIQFKNSLNDPLTRVLNMQKVPGEKSYKFTFCIIDDEKQSLA